MNCCQEHVGYICFTSLRGWWSVGSINCRWGSVAVILLQFS